VSQATNVESGFWSAIQMHIATEGDVTSAKKNVRRQTLPQLHCNTVF
jgi:hypothetical protein